MKQDDPLNKVFLSLYALATLVFITACQSLAAPTSTVKTHPTIVKSPNDPREYRYLQLDNGIRVALVSAPGSRKSSIAVDVHAGSAQEPDTWPGLAHLLEHMLFLGSQKYPEADEFDDFIQSHNGSSNAWTTEEDTVYHLTMPNKFFPEAIERLSWFFISPRIDPDYLDRERHAVDSEFQIYRQQDARRFYHIEEATANPAHPGNRFSTGNLETLKAHDGLDLREALITFYNTWYTGSNISIALVSNQSLDKMEKQVRTFFSSVRF